MASTAIGRVTSATGKEGQDKPRKVGSVQAVVEGGSGILEGAARFISRKANRHRIRVTERGGEDIPGNGALVKRVIAATNGGYIQFDGGAYVTSNPDVIEWLRSRLAAGTLKNVEEDISMLDIRCPECDLAFKNTTVGHRELGKHVLAEHKRKSDG